METANETTMKEYILQELEEYTKSVKEMDETKFVNAVLESFHNAKTYRHYVLLITADMDEYFTQTERKAFVKDGYYQHPDEDRFSNKFFAHEDVICKMTDILRDEDMVVEFVKVQDLPVATVGVVTLNGVRNSNFESDFSKQNVK